ncbi:MAG: hypothetical protein ACOCU4_07050, partial [Alkalispirochaeta sp.]
SHGIRVSTRIAKGTNVAVQNGRLRLRGRYGTGPTKLNLSKSGVSFSTKNGLGTFNWTNPNRSSAKIAGVQMRGKKAANLQMIYLVIVLLVNLIKFAALLLVWTVQGTVVVIRAISVGSVRLGESIAERARRGRANRLSKLGERAISRGAVSTSLQEEERLRAALTYAVAMWGRGLSSEDLPAEPESLQHVAAVVDTHALDGLIEPGRPRREVTQMQQVTAALAARYAAAATQEQIAETLLRLDEAARTDGDRTRLQDALIDIYADRARPMFST